MDNSSNVDNDWGDLFTARNSNIPPPLDDFNHSAGYVDHFGGASHEQTDPFMQPPSFVNNAVLPFGTLQPPSGVRLPSRGKRRLDAVVGSDDDAFLAHKRRELFTQQEAMGDLQHQASKVGPSNIFNSNNNWPDATDRNKSNHAAAEVLRQGLQEAHSNKDPDDRFMEEDGCVTKASRTLGRVAEDDGDQDRDGIYESDYEDGANAMGLRSPVHGAGSFDMTLLGNSSEMPPTNNNGGVQPQGRDPQVAAFSPMYSEDYTRHFNPKLSPTELQVVHLLLKQERNSTLAKWGILRKVKNPSSVNGRVYHNAYQLEVLRAIAKGSELRVARKIYEAVPMLMTWTFNPVHTVWKEAGVDVDIHYQYPVVRRATAYRGRGYENETEQGRAKRKAAIKYEADLIDKYHEITDSKPYGKCARPKNSAAEPTPREPQVPNEDTRNELNDALYSEDYELDYEAKWKAAFDFIQAQNCAAQSQNDFCKVLLMDCKEHAETKQQLREKEKQVETLKLQVEELKSHYQGDEASVILAVAELREKNQALDDNLKTLQDQMNRETQHLKARVEDLERELKERDATLAAIRAGS